MDIKPPLSGTSGSGRTGERVTRETSTPNVPGGSGHYNEKYRPQFHFTYRKGWASDINGPVFYDGEYHLFTQHNPSGPERDFANMHWGHAVSTDLVRWVEREPSLAPDENGPVFSGSTVVDHGNTSGLQRGSQPPLIAFYTGARYMLPAKGDGVQCMAYSNDRGRSWAKHAGNPVVGPLTHLNRDPKVFWHQQTGKWVMALSLSCSEHWLDGDYRFALLSSNDLKTWKEMSRFEMPRGVDCPDMFELGVNGDSMDTRWVFWAGDGTHMIGRFDGIAYKREGAIHLPQLTWEEQGANGYAAQTFSNMPGSDGRRIQLAWLRNARHPDMPFSQLVSFPCELTLRTSPDGIRLYREPIREIELLRGRSWQWDAGAVRPGDDPFSKISGELFEIRAEITSSRASSVTIKAGGADLVYAPLQATLSYMGKSLPAGGAGGKLQLHILIDRTTIEIFADNGRISMTFSIPPMEGATPLGLQVRGGDITIAALEVWELKSIWR